MSSFSPLQLTLTVWGVIGSVYILLFLYRSIVGMKEEDTLYLSAGETKMAEQQRDVMKKIHRVEHVTKGFGWATLALTVLLAGEWGYSVYRELFNL
jgi:uncharacterized membrane protein